VEASEDPLETALRLAIAGNVIDFGANPDVRLEEDIQETLQLEPTINDSRIFKEELKSAQNILYVGDNAGETVFDRILIETMARPITYVVRERPIINDTTVGDAIKSGLDEVADLVSSGWDGPGVSLKHGSEAFLRHYDRANMIISKGQGNYETLSGEQKPIFFLLKAKCPVIARNLGVNKGDTVIKYALA
jgi:uncharacterized protein with ATP-grasp and redox domains